MAKKSANARYLNLKTCGDWLHRIGDDDYLMKFWDLEGFHVVVVGGERWDNFAVQLGLALSAIVNGSRFKNLLIATIHQLDTKLSPKLQKILWIAYADQILFSSLPKSITGG